MEINALVELYSKPIIITIQDNDHYNIKIIYDNIKKIITINIDDVIFLLFVNDDHYNLLIPKKSRIG